MDETRELGRFVARTRPGDIPHSIRHEAKRAILNALGCAIGGSQDETVERALAAVRPFAGTARATLIGRSEKLDMLNAALVNALSANILDFDDTHMRTIIHPSVPVAAAALALAEERHLRGDDLLSAFVLGVEVACCVGNAVSPEHYAAGWHITSTCGVIGAAAAAGKLLALNEQKMAWALGIAATQAAGLTSMMGSMSKSYNMAHAASGGLCAALMAHAGFTSSERALEAPRGFCFVLARNPKLCEITSRLGDDWALSGNAYKPYPCGIVLHAAIDACLELRQRAGILTDQVQRVDIRMHPLALELAGRCDPATGLESKLSAAHAAAVALVLGQAGVQQFTDDCATDERIVRVRKRVFTTPDSTLNEAAAVVTIELAGGQRLAREVTHALGSLERPMSDAQLEAKFNALAHADRYPAHASRIVQRVWSVDTLDDASELVAATAEPPGPH